MCRGGEDTPLTKASELNKYSDLLAEWLVELGYTHCFYLSGGHIMHLLESCSRRFTCIPVTHEVTAGIAAEYFNEVHLGGKAFALVTSGPGVTNIMTAIAGAYLESRELLVIGGQVKVADLASGQVRQRGIQEIDGVGLTASITARSARIDAPIGRTAFIELLQAGLADRRGPVFLEVPLDVQGAQVRECELQPAAVSYGASAAGSRALLDTDLNVLGKKLLMAKRPVILLGGGIDRDRFATRLPGLSAMGIPLMCTWNALDRVPSEHPLYFGRPGTWGQRYANVLLQQSDLLIAVGARLSLYQTGFNWHEFVPGGETVQVDFDPRELAKGHPHLGLSICAEANGFLEKFCSLSLPCSSEWLAFCTEVKLALPLVESGNQTGDDYLSPYVFVEELSKLATSEDLVVPCSSGGAFTVMMQTFAQKTAQRVVTNKALAAMGYGLGGAIGAAFAGKGRRTILVEGDGGFMQNLQELGTVRANHLNLKIFLFDDNGYASIRTTQKSYFSGRYVGCDISGGLGMPDWEKLFAAYGIPVMRCGRAFEEDELFRDTFAAPGPAGFLVSIDPEQTYYPKITSRVTASGSMESNPLHLMTPELDGSVAEAVLRFLPAGIAG
jgi:acetolactate synthase-1/2/3 large subunit